MDPEIKLKKENGNKLSLWKTALLLAIYYENLLYLY